MTDEVVVYSGNSLQVCKAAGILTSHRIPCRVFHTEPSGNPGTHHGALFQPADHVAVASDSAAQAREVLATLDIAEDLAAERLSRGVGWRLVAGALLAIGGSAFVVAFIHGSRVNLIGALVCYSLLLVSFRGVRRAPRTLDSAKS